MTYWLLRDMSVRSAQCLRSSNISPAAADGEAPRNSVQGESVRSEWALVHRQEVQVRHQAADEKEPGDTECDPYRADQGGGLPTR